MFKVFTETNMGGKSKTFIYPNTSGKVQQAKETAWILPITHVDCFASSHRLIDIWLNSSAEGLSDVTPSKIFINYQHFPSTETVTVQKSNYAPVTIKRMIYTSSMKHLCEAVVLLYC